MIREAVKPLVEAVLSGTFAAFIAGAVIIAVRIMQALERIADALEAGWRVEVNQRKENTNER